MKTANARSVERRSRDAAESHIEELRERCRAGAKCLRVVRLYSPDGGVRLIDFAQEEQAAERALREVERTTAARDRAVREAAERW